MGEPTLFWYSNAEDDIYRDLLIAAGVKRVMMNWSLLRKFSPTRLQHALMKLRDNGCQILIHPATAPLIKRILDKQENSLSLQDLQEMTTYAAEYRAWLQKWGAQVDFALNLDFDPVFVRRWGHDHKPWPICDDEGNELPPRPEQVETWDNMLRETGCQIIKIWHPTHTNTVKKIAAQGFKVVALQNVQNKTELIRYMMDARSAGVKVHAIGMARTEWLEQMRFHSATVAAWINGRLFGQTYVFDGRKLSYYKSDEKIVCRKRFADHFAQLGLDVTKIQNDDPTEVSKMNLRAWVDYEKYLHRSTAGAYVLPSGADNLQTVAPLVSEEKHQEEESHSSAPIQENPKTRSLLDLLQQIPSGDSSETVEVPAPFAEPTAPQNVPLAAPQSPGKAVAPYVPPEVQSHKSQRLQGNQNASKGFPTRKKKNTYTDGFPLICDNCFASEHCPKYKEHAVCGFRDEFTDMDTRDFDKVLDELESLAIAQKERTGLALLFEKVMMRGVPDKNTDRQIDRQMRLLEIIGKLRKEQGTVSVQLSANGIFATMFGAGVVDPARLPENQEFIDVEVEEP